MTWEHFTHHVRRGTQVGGINLGNFVAVISKAMEDPKLKGTTFEVFESSKAFLEGGQKSVWEEKLANLKPDTA